MSTALAFLLLSVPFAGAVAVDVEPKDPDAPKPREITVARGTFAPGRGAIGDPLKIANGEELKKAASDATAAETLAKMVNFRRENLLVFRWSGSGMDRLTLESGPGKEVQLHFTPGRTRDLRQHVKVFAVPKTWKHRLVK